LLIRLGKRKRLHLRRRDLLFVLPPLAFLALGLGTTVVTALNAFRADRNFGVWFDTQQGAPAESHFTFRDDILPLVKDAKFYEELNNHFWEAGEGFLEASKYSHTSTAELPQFHLNVPGRGLERLTSDLPASARNYQPGTLTFRGRIYKVKARLRGDGPGHWAMAKKSWRVKLRRGETIDGKYRRLNFVNPKSENMFRNPMSYWLAPRFGLKAPDCVPCALYVNGKYQGVYLFTEQVDEYFLRRWHLPRGDIFYGELKAVSWLQAERWDHHVPRVGNPEKGVQHFQDLFNLVGDLELPLVNFYEQLPRIVDLENYIDFLALHMFSGTYQPSAVHNQKLYLDPASLKLENFVWDFYGHGNASGRYEHPLTPLADRFYRIPPWVNALYRRSHELLQGPARAEYQTAFISQTAERMKNAVRLDMARAHHQGRSIWQFRRGYGHRKWEKGVKKLTRVVVGRNEVLRNMLADARLSLYLTKPEKKGQPWVLRADAYGLVAARLAHLTVKGALPHEETLGIYQDRNRNGMLDKEDERVYTGKMKDGLCHVDWEETFFPGRAKGPWPSKREMPDNIVSELSPEELKDAMATGSMKFLPYLPSLLSYPYFVVVPPGSDLHLYSAYATNDITGEAINVGLNKTLPLPDYGWQLELKAPEELETVSLHPWSMPKTAPAEKVRERIWSGEVVLEDDVKIAEGERLVIRPGTRIAMKEGCFLEVNGELVAEGTAEAPIVFAGEPLREWGGIVVLGKPEHQASARLSNVWIQNGAGRRYGQPGVFCARFADIDMDTCVFSDLPGQGNDAINARTSNIHITGCVFENIGSDAVDLDYCRGEIRRCLFLSSGQDAIDVGASSPVIRNNIILNAETKGVSCGEGAGPLIFNNYIAGCGAAVGAKSEAIPIVVNCTLDNNRIGFLTAIPPNKDGRPGWIEVHNTVVKGSLKVQHSPDGGRITFTNSHRSMCGQEVPRDLVDPLDIPDLTTADGIYHARLAATLSGKGSGLVPQTLMDNKYPDQVHSGLLEPMDLSLPAFYR